MKRIITAILCSLLFMSLPTLSETKQPIKSPGKSAPALQASLASPDLSTDFKLQQQKIEFFKERLDQQDKRIGDIGLYLAVFGALMTIMVVFFSLRSNREAVLAAKEEAHKEVEAQAKNIIGTWLGKDGQQLLVKKVEDTLRPEIDKALCEIRNATDDLLQGLEEEKRKAHDHNTKHEQLNEQQEKKLSELDSRSDDKDKPLSLEQKKSVDEAAKKLEAKPPNEYRFKDWFTLGRQAYASAKYEIAADHFDKAIGTATTPSDQAKALWHKGFTLARMERSDDAIAVYEEIVRRFDKETEEEMRVLVAKALMNKGFRLSKLERSEEEITVYDEVMRRFGNAAEPELRERVAKALLYKGITLGQLKRNIEVIAVYDEVVRRFGDAAEPVLLECVAKAMLNKGVTLGQLKRNVDEIAVYDEVVRRFGDAVDPTLHEKVAVALRNKGITLGQMERNEEAIAAFDEVVRRFGNATEVFVLQHVAHALLSKGNRLSKQKRSEEAIAAFDEVVSRFGDSTELVLRERVARALQSKGVALGQLERSEEEIAVYDEVMQRFGDAKEPILREQVARTLIGKGIRLGKMERIEEAINIYEELIRRFDNATEPLLLEQVAMALNGVGFHLLCKAKKTRNAGNVDASTVLLEQAFVKIEAALQFEPDSPVYLGNKGYILFLMGKLEEATSILKRAIALGGDELRNGELADAEIHPLPQDDSFKALIKRL